MKLVGIDFETNGVDPHTCSFTEVGLVFYDTDFGLSPIESISMLNKEVKTMDPTASKITGITLKQCHTYGSQVDAILGHMFAQLNFYNPDFLVAHNAHAFDEIIFNRLHKASDLKLRKEIPWIDTMEDLSEETYAKLGTRTLEFMAARSGFINPFPHAALSDVMTMMKILFENGHEHAAERSKVPSVIVNAVVSFDNKDLAKAQGYYWQQIRGGKQYTKKWVKKIKKDMYEIEKELCPFNVVIID